MSSLNRRLWQFSPIPNIEESNFNKILERFYDMKVTGLTRENTQNALDGRLRDNNDPVILTIETGSIKKEEVPGIDEVIERIKSLRGRNSYTKETIEHMLNKINQDEVRYISFEDFNTRGLTGAKNGQSDSPSDTWAIYAYNKGVHSEEEDTEIETSRGGSHGVGKIASNAASDIHVMYFANCDAEGNQHLGGTVQLIEHTYKNQSYRSTGYFTDIKEVENNKTKFYPFENNFHKIFEKKTRGLKIIIPYLREEYDNENEIIKSICDSFFVSILKGKLIVIVNGKKITDKTLMDYVKDSKYYVQNIAEMKENFTPLYVETYSREEPKILNVSDGINDYRFKLYFNYNEEISKGRVAIVRTIGMKIEDMKVKNNASKPFNAVLIGGPNEDLYLKSLENESHTQLSYEHIKNPLLQKRARKFINNLSREISKIIEEAIKTNNPTDGTMNTKDILYIIETQFKKDLADAMGTVNINKGKSLVKMTTDIPKKKKKSTSTSDGRKKTTSTKTVKLVKPKPVPSNVEEEPSIKYSAHPDIVERVILGNNEIIKFDFTQTSELINEELCNISLSIIDGMGVEYEDDFNIKKNYINVIDLESGRKCEVNNNLIKDVTIKNGVSKLKLELNSNYNKALKFIYYIEV
ncbi:hypothetical protein H9636_05165 [Ureibacillus sp. Re31]|uniref:Uncharacterized protein n=1 Tax=Ureibacillus galli TaxID=2762222 RepID=A0ABR8X9N9_9BACL|nr:hypothetical protein [Ureibacillus galli]MBD8026043.1 hypothetical protein [Ureibacillus galli]